MPSATVRNALCKLIRNERLRQTIPMKKPMFASPKVVQAKENESGTPSASVRIYFKSFHSEHGAAAKISRRKACIMRSPDLSLQLKRHQAQAPVGSFHRLLSSITPHIPFQLRFAAVPLRGFAVKSACLNFSRRRCLS